MLTLILYYDGLTVIIRSKTVKPSYFSPSRSFVLWTSEPIKNHVLTNHMHSTICSELQSHATTASNAQLDPANEPLTRGQFLIFTVFFKKKNGIFPHTGANALSVCMHLEVHRHTETMHDFIVG